MSERLKEHDWKSCVRVCVPRVQIPLSPPNKRKKSAKALFFFCLAGILSDVLESRVVSLLRFLVPCLSATNLESRIFAPFFVLSGGYTKRCTEFLRRYSTAYVYNALLILKKVQTPSCPLGALFLFGLS